MPLERIGAEATLVGLGPFLIGVRSMDTAISQYGIRAAGATGPIHQLGQRTLALGGQAVAATANLVGLVAQMAALAALGAIRIGIQFEEGFAGIAKTVEATDEQLAELRQQVRRLAIDLIVPTQTLNEIGEAAGAAGVEIQDMSAFMRTVAQFATAAGRGFQGGAADIAQALAQL